MYLNPVYLVLGVLSAAYAAPLDTGINHLVTGQVNSDVETYIRARSEDDTIHVMFEGKHAVQMVHDSGPSDDVQTIMYLGLERLFSGFKRGTRLVLFENGFKSPEKWPTLELQIRGIGRCLYVWCNIEVTPEPQLMADRTIMRSASAKFLN
ncbi:hypothetical protein F5050DRAFT_143551 [Lentinula boryana]|uniref:Uncharacterized protein n=1 Tax=Lentinula boryana TaxID=40481 RepID=A0ABQ8QCX0_9AGAR|nr:hypothetical protein F5050DRAFT_143551 [Lentinula boryana]